MNKELAKKEITETLPAELMGSWGADDIANEDILLPKILLMQAMSEMVNEKELAQAGDIIKSTDESILGGRDKPVTIIPITSFRTWVISCKAPKASKFEFKSVEPITALNVSAPLDWKGEDGSEWRRDKQLNFYVLLKTEAEAEAAKKGVAIPCLLAFKRTSYTAGRKIISGMAECKALGTPAASKSYELRAEKKTNDLGTYFVWDVKPSKGVSRDELTVARKWYDTLRMGKVKVDEAGEE